MRTYKQLTQYHRYHIRIYWKSGYSLSTIATLLCVDKSTISREIRRNTDGLYLFSPFNSLNNALNSIVSLCLGTRFTKGVAF